jgi:uncharacterized protein YgiM (DUF1202 family)
MTYFEERIVKQLVIIIMWALTLSSTVLAAEIDMQVLACGTVQISTNTAKPGKIGATVMTTSIVTEENVFRLRSFTEEEYQLVSSLKKGDKVTFFGIIKATLNPDGSTHYIVNPNGSIDMALRFVSPGCK